MFEGWGIAGFIGWASALVLTLYGVINFLLPAVRGLRRPGRDVEEHLERLRARHREKEEQADE